MTTLAFEGLLFGQELADRSFPSFESGEGDDERDCDGFFDGFVCGVQNLISYLKDTFRVILGVIKFFFNLITFNVPGAPWYVRLVIGGTMGGALVWSLATLFRGST